MHKITNNFFKDSIVALVTPFNNQLEIDEHSSEKLMNMHIQAKSSGIVIAGTTAESPVLTKKEKMRLLEIALQQKKQQNSPIKIIFNCGTNNTTESIELAQEAANLGADALMAITPYYNKPTQRGLYAHFQAIAAAVSNSSKEVPICLYNVPSRTGISIEISTITQLVKEHSNIVAMKDAVPDLTRPLYLRDDLKMLDQDTNFSQLSGEDATALAYVLNGGQGCISVAANVVPELFQKMFVAFRNGELEKARAINFSLTPLYKVLFIETNPAPVKYALSLMGMCSEKMRLPLTELTSESKGLVRIALEQLSLI